MYQSSLIMNYVQKNNLIDRLPMNYQYLDANRIDELWGLYVTTIGFQSIAANMPYPPSCHPVAYSFDPHQGRTLDEYQILYLINGKGQFRSASCGLRQINAGDMILSFPGEWHSYMPSAQTGWEGYWIGFKGATIDGLISNRFFSPEEPVVDVGFNEQMVSLFKQGLDIAQLQKPGYQSMLAGTAQMLCGFIHYAERNNAFRDKEIVEKVNRAKVLMQSDNPGYNSPEKIAEQLNIGYSWFRKVFKQYTGYSPALYYNELRLKKAKELLTNTAIPVKEISFSLNFESPSYFITFFKAKVGVSPSRYRENVHTISDRIHEVI